MEGRETSNWCALDDVGGVGACKKGWEKAKMWYHLDCFVPIYFYFLDQFSVFVVCHGEAAFAIVHVAIVAIVTIVVSLHFSLIADLT